MISLLPSYAELHCLSNFTFLRGASHPEELVERAHKLGYSSLAITDECSFAGVVRAHVKAKELQLHLIIGSEMLLACGLKLVLLAMHRDGYGNLAEWISLGRCRAAKGSYDIRRADIGTPWEEGDAPGPAHLRGLPDCLALFIADCRQDDAQLDEQAAWVAATFPGRAAIALHLLQRSDDACRQERLHALSQRYGMPLVACGFALQPNAEQFCRQTLFSVNSRKIACQAGRFVASRYELFPSGKYIC